MGIKRKGTTDSSGKRSFPVIGSSSSQGTISPVDDKTVVKINRVNGKTGLVEEVAVGRYNSGQQAWEFKSSEQASKKWLEEAFNNPPKAYAINEEGFLFYIMTTVMPRKGWIMDWKVGDFVNKDAGKPKKPDFSLTEDELKGHIEDIKRTLKERDAGNKGKGTVDDKAKNTK